MTTQKKSSGKKYRVIEELQRLDDQASDSEIIAAFAKAMNHQLWRSTIGRWVFGCSMVLAAVCVGLILRDPGNKVLVLLIYVFWTISPPAWLLYEYVWLFPSELKYNSTEMEDMKYAQGLAGKVWAGLVVVMTATIAYYLKVNPFDLK